MSATILVLLPKPLGDIVLCTPALRYLAEALPGARFVWQGSEAACRLLDGLNWADAFVDVQGRVLRGGDRFGDFSRVRYDGAILFSNSFRTAWAAVRAGARRRIGYRRDGRSLLLTDGLPVPGGIGGRLPVSMIDYYGHLARHAAEVLGGAPDTPFDPRLELANSTSGQEQLRSLLERWKIGRDDPLALLVVAGAFGPSKLWPARRFAALADWLTERGFRPVLVAAPGESAVAGRVREHARGPLYDLSESPVTLEGLKALVARARIVIGNDTGPAHIAAAFRRPLVTLFGPTDPRWTATHYPGEIRLRVDVDCGPCQQKVCATDHRCMTGIPLERVRQAIEQILAWTPADARPVAGPVSGRFSVYDESYCPLPDSTGVVHKSFADRLGQAGLGTLEQVFRYRGGEPLTKPGLGIRQRIRLELPNPAGTPTGVYLKRFGRPPLKERLARCLARGSTAALGAYDFFMAHHLARLGLAVPRPIAWGQQLCGLTERRSFAMLEELPRGQALDRLLSGREPDRHHYRLLHDRPELIRRLARLAARLHGGGYCHRDLYLCHVFLCQDADGTEYLALIDLQRVFRPRFNVRRWRVKDLSQLCYSAAGLATRTDMMRFLHHYFGRSRLTCADKQLARAAWNKARRIERRQRRKERTRPTS